MATLPTPDDIIRFWLEGTPPDRRFAKDAALDAEIARRFGAVRDAILAGAATGWREDPRALLAAVIALDQFSRNIHRGSPRAFEADALARDLTSLALARGWDADMSADERQFLYMPLMHSEDADDQARSVALFDALGDAEAARFARAHARQIDRFGRFPGRNATLGRASTKAEREFLTDRRNAF